MLSPPQEIQPVWKSVEDLFSFLAQSHLEAVRESTGEGVWSSDHCREAGGVRSLSAGPQTDYSPFSPIWTGRGRFCTLFPKRGATQTTPVVEHLRWNRSYMKIEAREIWNIHTFLPFAALSETVSETSARFFWLLQHPFRTVSSESRRFDYRLSASGAGIMFLR